MCHIFFIHSSVEGHLGGFLVLAITNNAAMNIVEHISLLLVGGLLGYIPKSGIAGSCCKLIPIFPRNRCHRLLNGLQVCVETKTWMTRQTQTHLRRFANCCKVYFKVLGFYTESSKKQIFGHSLRINRHSTDVNNSL